MALLKVLTSTPAPFPKSLTCVPSQVATQPTGTATGAVQGRDVGPDVRPDVRPEVGRDACRHPRSPPLGAREPGPASTARTARHGCLIPLTCRHARGQAPTGTRGHGAGTSCSHTPSPERPHPLTWPPKATHPGARKLSPERLYPLTWMSPSLCPTTTFQALKRLKVLKDLNHLNPGGTASGRGNPGATPTTGLLRRLRFSGSLTPRACFGRNPSRRR